MGFSVRSGAFSRFFVLPLLGVIALLLQHFGLLSYLWVFPLGDAFGMWFLWAAADACLSALQPKERWLRIRLLLWVSGALYFTALSGMLFIGMVIIVLPPLFWVESRRSTKGIRYLVLLAVLLALLAGHPEGRVYPAIPHPERFFVYLFSTFFLFRLLSWSAAVFLRKERPGFLHTMEYFLAPAFWLAPTHASAITLTRMKSAEDRPDRDAFGWILYGILLSVFFSLFYSSVRYYLEDRYARSLWAIHWSDIFLGPTLFTLTYMEKLRVSFFSAGFLRMAGYEVEPDFRSPWKANSLLDYWRRFHYWILEFYQEVLFTPISVYLARRMRVEWVIYLSLFLVFSLGTAFMHYLAYPGSAIATVLLAILFGVFTLLHYLMRRYLENPWVGIPVTWVSVWILYILAYPILGLGWNLSQIVMFVQ